MEIKKLLWLCSIFVLVHSKKKPKSVTTIIDAKWQVTPLALEIAEYIAEENELSFWKYLDSIAELDPPLSHAGTDSEQYNRALEVASEFLSSSQISLLKFALSLHIYSPKIEMFGQIARESGVDCSAAVDINGEIICHNLALTEKKINEALVSNNQEVEILRLDHLHPESKESKLVVILYATIGTPEFSDSHKLLTKLANDGKIKYIFRHWVKERPPKKLRLSGYGVELQLKSTEYKVQDDTKVEGGAGDESEEEEEEVEGLNFSKLRQLYPDKVKELGAFRQVLLESSSELAPLKVWQFQELSLQAAQRIMSAPKEEALHVMTHIAQNFPSQARSLVKTHVSPELKNEIRENQDKFSSSLHLQPSDTALFINGMYFDLETQDVFSILDYLRMELRVMEGLHNIGITEKKVLKSLLSLDLSSSGSDYALDFRDSAVMWLNDVENDKRYRLWSSSLTDLLRPTFPGMLRSIRRNLYNLVIIGDPSQKSVSPLIRLMQSFLVHSAPMRLGIVFAVDNTKTGLESSGVAMLNAFNYISELKDPAEAINFITDVYEVAGENEIQPEHITKLFMSKYPGAVSSEIFGPESDYNTGLALSADFLSRSGLRRMPQALFNGVPLPEKSLNADEFEEVVLTEVMNQTPKLQKAVYRGDLNDRHNVVDYMMSKPNVMPRLNDRILSTTKATYIDLTNFAEPATSKLLDGNIYYFVKNENQKLHSLTLWLILDLNSEDGKKLLKNALEYMENNGSIRIAIIFNSDASEESSDSLNLKAAALMKTSRNILDLKDLLDSKVTKSQTDDLESLKELLRIHRSFCSDVIKFKKGELGVITNGRVIGPFDKGEDFNIEDFGLLDRFSMSSYIQKIEKAILKSTEDHDSLTSDMLMKCVSLLVSRPETKSRYEINAAGEKHSVVKISSMNEGPTFNLVAITDPISHGAHKLSTLVSVLQQIVNCDIKIFLNCVEKNSDMPLKSFYRYVLEPSITFLPNGQLGPGPIAKFSNMPGAPLLTQNMLVPDNWMVESIASPHDLDNIKLDQVDSNVHSQFELEYLILEGHCFDSMSGSPPRGLQVTLGTDSQPTQFDTIVMANLGYLQLKSGPGAWKLRLRHGRSAALYDITGYSHDGVDYPVNNSEIKVLLSSFGAHTIKLKVTKKPDKVAVDLLGEDNDEQQSLWGSLTSTFGGREETNDNKEENINIFSVASGHLYERFLRIMMLSVIKHTQKPVKFWFLKNYLSPTFKDFLPRMARHYKFQYELVQYKWPRWLHQQTEKQRIIWGYKLLFLDVLFPLDVKKIIFVDADQVVRADLNELVELDLGGAPYGYTPFCDSRKEMDGFRFWKEGYWRSHLQGRKYHISALYVVDLKRFRRIAAGDRLRGQYQALSQDPNSLSNLDQDLPNNMIHQVAIKSLPQEWLWCETWCDDASKKRAKTIDLCNNPMTKEAKLTAAMRILPEWKDYDNEIKQVQLKLGETEDHEEEQVQDSHQVKHSEL